MISIRSSFRRLRDSAASAAMLAVLVTSSARIVVAKAPAGVPLPEVTVAGFGTAINGFFKPQSLSDSTRQLGEFAIVVTGLTIVMLGVIFAERLLG